MRSLLALSACCFLSTVTVAQVRYFPNGVFSVDHRSEEFTVKWYTEQLVALHEPSLWELSKTQDIQSYRFLWLRTFHHPIAIRLDVDANGSSHLTTKMTSGTGGFGPGKLIKTVTVILSKEETDSFLGNIEKYKFWRLSSVQDTWGQDGAQWIIEGMKDRSYHIVDRWTPKEGDVRAIGLIMIDLAKVKIAPNELY